MADTATAPVAAPATAATTTPDAGKPASEATKPPEGVTAPKERIFKINGKDWPESQLAQRIQKAEGLEKRVADADKYEKAFNSFVQQAQDPVKLLELLNNPKALQYDDNKQEALVNAMLESKNPRIVQTVKNWLYKNEVEPASLTPEQRQAREDKMARETAEAKLRAFEEQQTKAAQEAETQRIWSDYRVKIGQGIKEAGLPETEMMVVRIARKAQMMRRAGQPANIQQAVASVKADLQSEYMTNLDKATDDELLNLLPESVLKKINAAFVKRLKKEEPAKIESNPPLKRGKKAEKVTKDGKDFWRDVGRGLFAQ